MASSSKKRNQFIAIDPTQLNPIQPQHHQQQQQKSNKKQKRIIHPQNVFKLNQTKLIELQNHASTSSHSHSQNVTSNHSNNIVLGSEDFFPTHPSQLAIHPKKIEAVHHWLNDALNGTSSVRKYRRLLVISGPAGSGKSSMIHSFSSNPTDPTTHSNSSKPFSQRVILPIKSRPRRIDSKTIPQNLEPLGFEILEWKTTGNESSLSKTQEFSLWLTRAAAGPTLSFKEEVTNVTGKKMKASKEGDKDKMETKLKEHHKRVLLVDDLPNLYHQDTLESFTNSIRFHLNSSRPSTPPLIISITDTNHKTGENGLDDSLLNINQFNQSSSDKPLNVHNFLPLDILNHPACFFIKLQPVNKTLMKKFINHLVDHQHFNSNNRSDFRFKKLTPSQLDLIIDSASGDLRSAINNLLQFFWSSTTTSIGTLLSNSNSNNKQNISNKQLLSHRDESLIIFHGLGKILYNKRWGDDPVEDAKDKRICGSKLDQLPPFWINFQRRLAKTDVDKLYAELSVPIQHFIVYLHHNYPQFLDTIEQACFLLKYLSLTDSTALSLSDNNRYNQISISEFYRFHVTVRSILLGLPSPVTRKNQKFYKPVLWDHFKSVNSNLILLDSFRDAKRIDSQFKGSQSVGDRPNLNDQLSQLDFDNEVSVVHSPRNLLAIEVLPFLGLISKFRRNNQHSSFPSNDEEEEIIAKFTKFNYPESRQHQDIIDENDLENADEEGDLNDNGEEDNDDDMTNQKKKLELIHQLHLGNQTEHDHKLWFEDDDDIIDD